MVRTIRGCPSGVRRAGQPGSMNSALILQSDPLYCRIVTNLLGQKVRLFQDQRRMPEEKENKVETAADSQFFAEFIAALEGKRSEVDRRKIDGLRAVCSKCGFEELLAALEAFDAVPPHAGIWSIEDESHRRVHDVEEKSLQFERGVCLLQHEVGDLSRLESVVQAA